jgi:hypothetical protein
MPEAEFRGIPFQEAIDYFRGKVNIPTKRWNDLWKEEHVRGFMVAGANKDEILVSFYNAVQKAISKGTTLKEFQADFDNIVASTGWTYKGSRGWRSRVIFETNVCQAFNAGRFQQQQESGMPYREYRVDVMGHSLHHRPDHLAWNGLVLKANDPWWDAHYPQNGWGCNCGTFMLDDADMKDIGKKGADKAPPVEYYTWTDKVTGVSHRIPKGIDPGFDYNPGKASFGQRLSEDVMEGWRKLKGEAWEQLYKSDWQSYGRLKDVPVDTPLSRKGIDCNTVEEATRELKKIIGGDEAILQTPGLFNAVHITAASVAAHADLKRSMYFPFIPEIITDPYEVWMTFEKHKGTGAVVLRQRYIKRIDTGARESLILVAQVINSEFEAWTIVPMDRVTQFNKQRRGKLVWFR